MGKRGTRRLTIFPKLILAFLAVIAPLYGIGLQMNLLGESSVREELSKSLKSKVDFYLNALEVENERMMGLLQRYVVDKDVQHLAFISNTMTIAEWSETVLRIQDKLETIKSSSLYVKSASAHMLTLRRTLSTEKSISDVLDEEYEAVASVYKNKGPGIFYWRDRLFLAVAYPGSDLPGMQETFVLSIELNLEALKKSLQTITDHERSGAMLVSAGSDWALEGVHDGDMASVLIDFLKARHSDRDGEGIEQIRVGNDPHWAAYKRSATFGYYLVAYVPPDEMLGPIEKYRNGLWILSFLSFAIIVAYSYWLYRLIRKPLHRMISGFRKAEAGLFEPIPLPKSNDEFLYLFRRFNMMMDNLKVLIHEVYEQKIRVQSSELKQLQSQIKPHFLYNTYFILYRLAKMNDNESVVKFSQHLGEYFQYITRNASDDVPLEAEIRHSRTYVEIQNIRFSKSRIEVDFGELPDGCREMRVPRLIVQPFIENAYHYGLESRRKDGKIVLSMERCGERLHISIEDNGEKLTDADLQKLEANLADKGKDMEYTGMLNVHRRLQIRFGEPYGVEVARGTMGGLKVTLKLPFGTAGNQDQAS